METFGGFKPSIYLEEFMEKLGAFGPRVYRDINHVKFKEEGFHLW